MTECERLIKNGFITEDFLKEETRDEYTITHEMKKVWAIELDLFRKFIELCESHGLTYWAGDGTLLGVVRHKGYIPWDDDLDVWLPREDYNKFIAISPDEIEAPYFLQTTENDSDYYSAFARLRNSNTTGVLVSGNNKCNNGIYIDIYPIDGLSSVRFVQKARSFRVHLKNVMANAYVFNVNPSRVARAMNKVLHAKCVPFNPLKTYKKVDKIASKIPWDKTEKVGHIAFTEFPYEKLYYDKKDFEKTIKMPFEMLSVNVPSGYDHILKVQYGDYLQFPPVEKRGLFHDFTFDPDTPYKRKKA